MKNKLILSIILGILVIGIVLVIIFSGNNDNKVDVPNNETPQEVINKNTPKDTRPAREKEYVYNTKVKYERECLDETPQQLCNEIGLNYKKDSIEYFLCEGDECRRVFGLYTDNELKFNETVTDIEITCLGENITQVEKLREKKVNVCEKGGLF